jgi:glutamine synthetase
MMKLTKDEVLKDIEESGVQKVKVAVTDIDGVLRGKYINKEKFLSAAESGFGFCSVVMGWDCNDVVYDNAEYTGWHTGYPDTNAHIDLSTYRRIPWDQNTPFFLGEFVDSKGAPLSICPRQLLKKVIKRSKDTGYEPVFGCEFEWFNFKETPQSLVEKDFRSLEPLTPGMFGYSLLRSSQNQSFFAALMDQLSDFRIPIEGLHTETGPGVLEAALYRSNALEAADRAVLFKSSVKEIAYPLGIMPTFMARWNSELPGCSGHLHQSLWNPSQETNVFFDEKDPLKMSKEFKSYLAGQIHCLPEILPFFAPNINSYKRLVEGYWAPTRSTWGVDNRTTAFRVIPGSSKSTRLETRVPGSDVNSYLAIAAALASGLYGIEKGLTLKGDPTCGNAYQDLNSTPLPKSLIEATERMNESQLARELFGDEFIDHFVATRRWEHREFQKSITDWELRRYFEII